VSGSITECLGRLKAGEADAARLLWERYARQLLETARHKLPVAVRRVADEEDIAQSVFTALWNGADLGRLNELANRDDLWWYLLATTRHKIFKHLRGATSLKRGGGNVRSFSDIKASGESKALRRFKELVSSEPTPEFVAMLEDEHNRLLGLLRDDQLRNIAAWRIEGYSIDEIATRLQIAPRSVTRKLMLIRNTWANEVGQ
jgi:DNA-directed RNA polymerase specialized sigma24 family protein